MAKTNPKKSEMSSQRYERLLKGEIDAEQYVRSLRQEARGRYRSAVTGRYVTQSGGRSAAKSGGSRVAKRVGP
jgi:hypothetical protein